jgi:hypothetical protein
MTTGKTLVAGGVPSASMPKSSTAIRIEEAQFAAASMANRAAREVLSHAHPGEMHAVLCDRFKKTYELMLGEKYAGSRVRECRTAGIETVPFGIKLGEEPAP